MNTDKIAWKVLESYFLNNRYTLTQHHINSYDNFFNVEIFNIIKEKNPIKIYKNFDEILDDFKFKCDLFIGGIDSKNLYFGKPIIYDNNNNHYMYPNEARLRNMTYAFTIHYDILVKYTIVNDDNSISESSFTIPKIFMGKVPVMLHSSKCILRNVDRTLLFNMGECKNDYGGYFIVDGKEKVIVPQEKFADNMVCYKKNSDDNKYSYSAVIRTMSEDSSKPVRTLKMHMVRDNNNYMGNIVVEVPNVRMPVPFFILMRALGIVSDKSIIECCLLNIDENKKYIQHFKPCVYDAGTIFTQENAMKYISQFLKFKTIPYTYCILTDYLLPQIGEMNFKNKAYFLGYMAFNLLKTSLNVLQPTDRDSFKYKRVELPGNLIYDLFKEYYTLQQKDIQLHIENDLYYHYTNTETNYLNITENQLISEVFSSEFIKDDDKDNKKKYKLGYNEIFKNKILDEGFKKAFKGRWGATPQTNRIGLIQPLERLSYNAFIAHLRKINLPLDSSAKVVGPRLCHSSQYGLIDPVDTPDGGNCGLHKQLAITTMVTNSYSYEDLLYWLRENTSIRLLQECNPSDLQNKTKIFINGTWIAITNELVSFVNFVKFSRRIGIIPIYTSVATNYLENEIELFSDGGRLTRPLFYVDENKELSINSTSFRNAVESGSLINWNNIIYGFNAKNVEINNNFFYKLGDLYNTTIEEIDKNKAVVEYLDTAELNTSLLSTNLEKLKVNNKYTHLEIHPSCMFGYMGNLVIYPETNPLPRNLFSCGQSKQAVSLYNTNYMNRVDKTGIVLNYGQVPLVKSKYMNYFNKEENIYGENTIVAIGCYGGYNVEDAILINKGSVDRGLFRTTYYSVYEASEESSLVSGNTVNSKFADVEKLDVDRKKYDYDYSLLNEQGLIKDNTRLDGKSRYIVIGKVTVDEDNIERYFDSSVSSKKGQVGYVDKTFITDDDEGFRLAKVRIRDERIPSIGDKMASRSGQKGTIGLIIPEDDMPFTEDGVRPDLIINPHAIPSRMTIGQLIECITGKACCYYGYSGNCTSFQGVDHVDIFGKLLSKAGYESRGNEVLYNGETGEQMEASLFMGPTYYMRLKHMVKDKINYRAKGKVTALTKQPVQGRANDGGLRIGEMERDGVIGHGATSFLKESMMTRGDKYQIAVCNNTGTIAAYNASKNILLSLFSDGPVKFKLSNDEIKLQKITKYGRSFSLVDIPYSLKLLIQELQTMNIQTRIITEDNIDQLENMSYSNTYKNSSRDIEFKGSSVDDIKQLLGYYSNIRNNNTRQNIRIEGEDNTFFEVDDDYDLHEFDEPEEIEKDAVMITPDSPGYSPYTPPDETNTLQGPFTPKSPEYSPNSPEYSPYTPPDGPFTPKSPEYAYDEEFPGTPKGTPPDVQIERAKREKENQLGGKISLDIGSKDMQKVSEKNITFDGGSILQPQNIENEMKSENKKKLDDEINTIVGNPNDEENSDEESNSNTGNGGKKKVLSFNL